jgi:integrase
VVVREEEKTKILAAAPPSLQLWLLLCSDLAIRSGTAATLGPDQYDKQRQTLVFTTKMQEKVTLPVTTEIRKLIAKCSLESRVSFVRQLRLAEENPGNLKPHGGSSCFLNHQLQALLKNLGLRRVTPHDFRRTTAVAIYKETKDLLMVQALLGHSDPASTGWYLVAYRREVPATLLELVKKPMVPDHQKELTA